MFLFAILAAPVAAFALNPAEPAELDGAQSDEVTLEIQETELEERVATRAIEVAVEEEVMTAMPVQLVSWDGDFEFMKTSRRLRIWRSHIAYNLTVDAEGNATGCELTETFRMRRVSDSLCAVLMEHHTFEPAHDESGTPVAGEYSARLAYAEMYERLN
ncbi:hypothetical protein [Erythrobacter sp. Alg231-14]|uniref:hypothetical protein n=1 Tax=Erythrobacter sp. Alg231-14 TaxID=1922225 RepID=UPI000D55D4DD